MSHSSLFSTVVSVLAAFNIKPPVDEHGNAIQLKAKVTSGLLSWVFILSRAPFDFTFVEQAPCPFQMHYRASFERR